MAAQQCALITREVPDIDPLEEVLSGGDCIQTSDDVHTGALSRAARSHDGDKLPPSDREVHPPQCLHGSGTLAVNFAHPPQLDHRCRIGLIIHFEAVISSVTSSAPA